MEKKVKFGELAVQMGLISTSIVEECLQIQKQEAAKARLYLGQVMVSKKYLTEAQIATILKAQNLKAMVCPHCKKISNASLSEPNVTCAACGKPFQQQAQPQPAAKTQASGTASPQTAPQTAAKARPTPQPQPVAKTQAPIAASPQTAPQTAAKAQPAPQPQPAAKTQASIAATTQTAPQPAAKAQPAPQPQPAAKTQAPITATTQTAPQPAAKAQPAPQPAAKAQPAPQPQPAAAKTQAPIAATTQPAPQPAAKAQPAPQSQPVAKTQAPIAASPQPAPQPAVEAQVAPESAKALRGKQPSTSKIQPLSLDLKNKMATTAPGRRKKSLDFDEIKDLVETALETNITEPHQGATGEAALDELPASFCNSDLVFAEQTAQPEHMPDEIWNAQTQRSVGKINIDDLTLPIESVPMPEPEVFPQQESFFSMDEIMAPANDNSDSPRPKVEAQDTQPDSASINIVQEQKNVEEIVEVVEEIAEQEPISDNEVVADAINIDESKAALTVASDNIESGKTDEAVPEAVALNVEEMYADQQVQQDSGANQGILDAVPLAPDTPPAQPNTPAQPIPDAVAVDMVEIVDHNADIFSDIAEVAKALPTPAGEPPSSILDSIPLDFDEISPQHSDNQATVANDHFAKAITEARSAPQNLDEGEAIETLDFSDISDIPDKPVSDRPENLLGLANNIMEELDTDDPSASDTFGLMPVGDAIDLEGNQKKNLPKGTKSSSNVFPLSEIDFARAGIDLPHSFGENPASQTQEFDFNIPGTNQIVRNGSNDEEGEIESDFFSASPAPAPAEKSLLGESPVGPRLTVDFQGIAKETGSDIDIPPLSFSAEEEKTLLAVSPANNNLPFPEGLGSFSDPKNDRKSPSLPFDLPQDLNRDAHFPSPDRNEAAKERTSGKAPKAPRRVSGRAGTGTGGGVAPNRRDRRPSATPALGKQNIMLLAVLGALLLILLIIVFVLMFSNPANKKKRQTAESPVVQDKPGEQKNPVTNTTQPLPTPNNNTPQPQTPQTALGNKTDAQLDQIYMNARRLFEQNRPGEASKQFSELLSARNNFKDAKLYLAECYLQTGELDNAQKLVAESLQQKPSAWGYTVLGLCKERRNNPAEASQDYQQALRQEPGFRRAVRCLVKQMTSDGKELESVRFLKEAIKSGSKDLESDLNQIREGLDKKLQAADLQQKLQLLEKAIEYDNDFPSYYLRMGILLWQMNPKKSLEASDKFVELYQKINPEYRPITYMIMQDLALACLYQLQEYGEVEKRALQNLPGEKFELPTGSMLALAQVYHYKDLQNQKSNKDDKGVNHKLAVIYLYLFDKIVNNAVANLQPQYLTTQPWLQQGAQQLYKEIGADLKKVKEKHVKSVCKIQLLVLDAINSPFQKGDIITRVNDEPLYSYPELFNLAKDKKIEKILVERNANKHEILGKQVTAQVLLPAQFQFGYRIESVQ